MTTEEMTYHQPVLLHQSIDGLNIHKDGIYVDVTFGGGGHSREILSRLEGKAHLYSFDQDADAEQNIVDNPRFTFIRSNFRYLKNFLRYYGEEEGIDGLLADLGVSSHHFDDAERGFSFRFDAPLDMRMNQRASQTAADVINTYSEQALADIFYYYGELKNSRQIAAAILKERDSHRIETTGELQTMVQPFLGRDREKKELAKVFQALRIEVNHELDALKEMLTAAAQLLKPGGRLVVITYHSLEDRMVKNIMKTGNTEGDETKDFFGNISSPFKLITRKPIIPDDNEQAKNPRSRSAKLRVASKN
ncbi:MAG: 16S rRNA (cytosine(1402)-N(4))-methyltransferase RsmH [Bacteroidaceae bacterium]|nr:16S rRNA (cytosine(1402)-N(4))-methyltransferase RsmH [Bacteroidaceae bacterium]